MAKVGNLLFIKVSPLFIGVVIVIFIVLAIVIYMKKRNAEQS